MKEGKRIATRRGQHTKNSSKSYKCQTPGLSPERLSSQITPLADSPTISKTFAREKRSNPLPKFGRILGQETKPGYTFASWGLGSYHPPHPHPIHFGDTWID